MPRRPGRPAAPARRPAGRRWQRYDLDRYAELHDELAADGTSRLSPYLHFGCLSAAELVASAERRGGSGAEAFVRQLAWRDFHHQVLAARPDAAHRVYRWLHNRARLVTASFLTKTLYQDWRPGARHFLRLLVDGDLANNQLNWQWVAGAGTDTRPNHVLNPLAQADRLDPDGAYVRRWVPELAALPGRSVHRPWRQDRPPADCPAPLVDPEAIAARLRQGRGLG